MFKWGSIINSMETSNPPTTIEQQLELESYYYGFIGHMLGKKRNDVVDEYLERAEKLNTKILKASPKNPAAHSFKGSFLGFHIGLNRFKSVYLGPESKFFINKAVNLDPNNITALILKGNMLFYAPGMFGGDKEDALELYLKAEKLIEKSNDTDYNWEYLNLLTTLGRAYEHLNRWKDAKLMYEKALQKEPNYHFVKDELYPRLLNRMR